MERRRSRASLEASAMVKAAAWAWYLRGSGSEGKPITEFHINRAPRPPIPSRYKLEAMRMTEEASEKEGLSATSPRHISLLDMYEIQRISEELDCMIETGSRSADSYRESETNMRKKKKMKVKGFWARHGILGGGGKSSNLFKESEANMRKKKKIVKGFWARRGIVCGKRDDVLETRRVLGGDGGRWEKQAGSCRP